MRAIIRPALVLFSLLTIICTLIYPAALTLIGQLAFFEQVNGSLLFREKEVIGSLLIGQNFTSPQYFWGRPSMTGSFPNNALASSGSNLGPTNPTKLVKIQQRVLALKASDPKNETLIPIDLVTASGSGLDPEISLAAAYYQIPRIARARHMTVEEVQALVMRFGKTSYFGFLGEPRVNVLALNLALDLERKEFGDDFRH